MIGVKEFTDCTILRLEYDEFLERKDVIVNKLTNNHHVCEIVGGITDFSVNIKVTPKLDIDKHGNSLVTSKGNVKFIEGVWE